CEAAAAFFGVPALRDLAPETFAARAGELDPLTRRRAQHVITENARTLAARDAMQAGDAPTLGALMNASHASLRDDFEVSSPALDIMAEVAQKQPGCYGARMTGAGFGGCAVSLVEASAVEHFVQAVEAEYGAKTSHTPQFYICQAVAGASLQAL
ncbi:MAG: galactokinase, partial [Anaerolineae bacterium]|nr:galactokinase [Anaerolineae bacterium]